MFVITDDGPKLPWELDEDGHAGSKPAQVEAQDRSGAPSSPPGGPARTLGHRETGSFNLLSNRILHRKSNAGASTIVQGPKPRTEIHTNYSLSELSGMGQ